MKASGGCLCGAVRYEIDGEPVFSAHCHCRDCQRATGTGHVSVSGFRREAVTITGETRGFTVKGDSGQGITRFFCPVCGSLLYSAPEAMSGMINVTAGTLDDPSVFQPQASIYTKDRHAWDKLPGVAEFEAMPSPR